MKNLVSWFALIVGMIALVVSLNLDKNITAERIILKDKNGVTRGILDANSNVLISLFSEDSKEMLRITTHADGAQIDMNGPDAKERVRLSTWGSNYLSIMDERWNKRIRIGDLWHVAVGSEWKKGMGMASEKEGKLEIYHQIID